MLALRSLRDVEGVLGSFVWRRDGHVVASDAHGLCAPSALAAVVVRMERLCEAFANLGQPLQSTTLVYRERRIYVCRVDWAALAVVTSHAINAPALQLALDLSLRDLAQLGAALRSAGPSGPLRPGPAAAAPPPVETSRVSGVHHRVDEPQPLRSYRGQRLGE